jgi:hypothetical protein
MTSQLVFKGRSPHDTDIQANPFWLIPGAESYQPGLVSTGSPPPQAVAEIGIGGNAIEVEVKFNAKKDCDIEVTIYTGPSLQEIESVQVLYFHKKCDDEKQEVGFSTRVSPGQLFAVLVRSTCEHNKICKAKVKLTAVTMG